MKEHGKTLLLSFILALALWYNVSGKEKSEVWVDVHITYIGIPDGLIVSKGLEEKVSVCVRTAKGLVAGLQAREYFIKVELNKINTGTVEIPLHDDMLPFTGVYEVIAVTPPTLNLEVDTVSEKVVPLTSYLAGRIPRDMTVQSVTLRPDKVLLRGPSGVLAGIDTLRIPIAFSEQTTQMANDTMDFWHNIEPPASVEATPAKIEVALKLSVNTKEISFERNVHLSSPREIQAEIIPEQVTISVKVPESAAASTDLQSSVVANIALEESDLSLGDHRFPVRVLLPNHTELIGVSPQTVTVRVNSIAAPSVINRGAIVPGGSPSTLPSINGVNSPGGTNGGKGTDKIVIPRVPAAPRSAPVVPRI